MKKTKKASGSKKRPVLRMIMMAFTILFMVLLLISYLAPYINPVTFSFPAFMGLSYPFLVLINLTFGLIWLANGRKRAILPFAAIIIGFQPLMRHVQFNFSSGEDAQKEALNVLTFNVRLFDYYNFGKKNNVTSDIYDFLKESDADIVCFQEFFNKDGEEFPVMPTLKTMLKAKGHHVDYYTTHRKTDHYGLATYTTLPIVDSGHIMTAGTQGNYAIYTDVIWKKDTLRIYNIHMASIHFSPEDYTFYHEITQQKTENQDIKSGSVRILTKLNNAFKKRGIQADEIAAHIKNSTHPVLICGDFNDSPSSYTYHQLSENLADAFVESGYGLGKTYSGSFPSFRIDYILYDKKYTTTTYKTHRLMLSDHYPVSARLVHRTK